jgi:hypothetical protein
MPVDALSTSLHFGLHVSHAMGCCGKKRLLTVMTSLCASSAFVLLCIGVATDHWLYTVERVDEVDRVPPNKKQPINMTELFRRTTSGLWRKCVEYGTFCSRIDIFFQNLDVVMHGGS